MRKIISAIVLMYSCATCEFAIAQNDYVDISVDAINEVVLEFGVNRERFEEASCLIETSMTRMDPKVADSDGESHYYDFIFNDSLKRKLKRSDLRLTDVRMEDTVSLGWSTYLEEKGRMSRITPKGRRELKPEEYKERLPWHTFDPWMMPIVDPAMIEYGIGANSFFWQIAFSETGLLWAEENDRFLRGEWDVFKEGQGRTRIQAYFDKNTFKLPTLIRYVDPVEKEVRFPRLGERYESEINVKWEKKGKGFVPIMVEMRRVAYGEKRKVIYIQTASFDFKWDEKVVADGGQIDLSVFDVSSDMIPAEELYQRFKSK